MCRWGAAGLGKGKGVIFDGYLKVVFSGRVERVGTRAYSFFERVAGGRVSGLLEIGSAAAKGRSRGVSLRSGFSRHRPAPFIFSLSTVRRS